MKVVSISLMVSGLVLAGAASAQNPPSWGAESSASPTAGSSTSQRANETADRTMYRNVQYTNAGKQGPALVVIPKKIKSRSEEHTSELQSLRHLVCRLLLEKK